METMSTESARDLLVKGKVGHVGVIDDTLPYVSPVSYVVVNGEIAFRTAMGRRVDALRKNPAVSFEVMENTDAAGWECVIVSGEAREVHEDLFAQTVVAALLSKYREEIGSPLSHGARSPIPEPATYIAISIKEMTGRSSGTWISIPTRPGRL